MADRALLVGINEYAEAPLRGCINDVSDVRDLLIASCGFAQSDIRLLVDRQATTANIREALNQWLVADPGEHDRLFFHFSGHGTQLPGRDGVVRDVICPADFDFTEARSLSEVDFSGIFGSLPAGARFVWISDSCHSGELARGPVRHDAIPRYLPPPPQIMAQIDTLMVRGAAKRNLNSIATSLKGVLIAGCQAHETSADAQFNGRYNGALSYFLLQALRSQTAASEDINSVLQRVQGVLKREGFSQHPQLRGIADLHRRPFLMFRGLHGEALASVQPVAPDSGNVEAAASIGDGRYWDDAFETETTPRANPGWSIVQWQANDEKNVDYRHLAGSRYKNAQFEFTADDLELLIKANLFEPFRDRGKIIFALRGAELVAARSASPDDRFRQVARAALSLKETRPDHQKFRCVIGVYDARERTLSGFIASTVPCRQAVHSYANGGAPSNLLPTGCYQMVVGDHKGRIGCLIEGENFTVLRTKRDCLFDTEDVWDNTFPGDNLHPAFANGSAEFSSWGCQTIRGNCPPGTDAFTGEYKEFRRALGLRPGTADYGAKFSYVLLTGLEAATANILKDAALPQLTRLRHGSRGEPVRLLQERLSAATDGKFGAKLTKALADHQKKQLGWADGIYCAEMDVLLRLDVFGAQRPQAAPAEPSPVANPAIAPTPVAAYAPNDLPMSAPLAPLVQKIGSVCHIWDYPNRSCREKTDVWQVEGTQAAHFLSKLQVDADGAPRAYHPSDRSPPGNAGKAFDWLANLGSSDRHGIQGENGAVGPAAGFVISATSLVDGRFPVNDTRRYVDASSIPYVVLPKSTFPVPAGMSLKMGCVVCVVDTKTGGYSGAIFADVGRAAGEGSIRLAQRLGVTPFSSSRWPKVVGFSGGANDRRFFYLVFPASVVPAPWAVDEIQARADALFQAWGGKERLKSIVPSLPDVLPPVTVFNEEPPSTRELTADEEAGALRRLRSLDVSKEELSDHENDVHDEELDRGPVPGKLEPDDAELPRDPGGAHPDEMDGPDDLPPDVESRAPIPSASWPAADADAPCYAHLVAANQEFTAAGSAFEFTPEDLALLIAANAFNPEGHGGRIVFAFRGARLRNKDTYENVDALPLEETRPDHRHFNCVIGIFDTRARKLSAFKASTVPNVAYMTNYYRKANNLPPFKQTGSNLLPTGCYVYRVGVHGGNIYPALRLTDPEKLGEDGKVVVLRTSNDLTYRAEDIWDACVPYDHVHCAYSYETFSSAGCLTVCGPSTSGPWARFQSVLKTIPRNGRIDLVLLSGREAAIAADLRSRGQAKDAAQVSRLLARLRPGSQGEAVRRLQERLGCGVSGYFGWRTKQALVDMQRRSSLCCDGIYAPQIDRHTSWAVLDASAAAVEVVASRSAALPAARPRLLEADIRRFAPKALQGSLDALVRDGPTEFGLLGIDADPLRLCHFMAQIGHECGGFTIKSESLNYTTTARLRAVWPSRFPDDASGRPFLRNEEKLAEKVYGGRLGNVKRGDGYRYRGRGFVQITGRAAYREMGEKLKLPLEENPDLALEPAVALKIACRTWADKTLPGERGMNELADANKIEALTYRINGGYTNLEDRRAEFRKAWQIWGEGAAPDKVLGIEQLERGDRGTPVARLARDLRDLGYGTAGTSSIFGSNAYAAVRRFQQDHGLPVTGVAGPDTLAAVEEALGRKQAGRTSREGGSPREMARDAASRRQALLVRSVRIFAAGLAMLAALFGLAYLMSLGRPEYFGPLAMWLPLMFAGLVFIGAFLIGHWGTMIASSQPGERGMRQPADVPADDAEPVRDGIASGEAD